MKHDKEEIVFGWHAVVELLESNKDVEAVYIKQGAKGPRMTELRKLVKQKAIPCKDLPNKAFSKYQGKNHQGVVAVLSPIQSVNLEWLIPKLFEEGKTPFILILDQVTDVRNFGAICRTASCFGVDAVVFPSKNSAAINDFAVKSSAGAIFHLPICRTRSLTHTLQFLKDSGIQIMGCTEKASKNVSDGSFESPLAVIMGSEEKGISKTHQDMCDDLLRIPITGPIQSLNVGVATGIILSEIHKQRSDG